VGEVNMGFLWGYVGEGGHLKDQDVDERIVLKVYIPEKEWRFITDDIGPWEEGGCSERFIAAGILYQRELVPLRL
jgi:hypothetical protein